MKNIRIGILLLAICLMIFAGGCSCADDDDDDTAGSGDDDQEIGDMEDPLDGFFGLVKHTIAVTLDDKAVEEITEEPKKYTHAKLVIDDEVYKSVGFRLKGGAGSFIPWGGGNDGIGDEYNSSKSAFIIDFNRYEKGVNHLGLKKLTCNNMVQDESFLHEFLAYYLFRSGGVSASRTGFAQVTLNGDYKGLYALIETPDNEVFLKNHFGSDTGNLYEGEYGTDFESDDVEQFDQDNGDDETKKDLRELTKILDEIDEDEDAMDVLEANFDVETITTFFATEIYLWHWDGYTISANNYQVYHSLTDDKWHFIPWGLDQTFVPGEYPFSGVWRRPDNWDSFGRIQQLCLQSDQCRLMLESKYDTLLAMVEKDDLAGYAGEALEFITPLLETEPDTGDAELTVEQAYEALLDFIADRGEQIEKWLPCLAGDTVDFDNDTYDGCIDDCDDGEPTIHPGATEQCNVRDDDCNGILDDPETCPKCTDQIGPDDETYTFCWEPKTWALAEADCALKGLNLASVHEEEITWFIFENLMWISESWGSWIGLNDLFVEGTFVWADGSDLDFLFWGSDSPHDDGGDRDCVMNTPEGWHDLECNESLPYTCN